MTGVHTDGLAERFEQHRPRLTSVAYRLLGSMADTEDVVQEAWLRFSRADAEAVDNLGAWLTTVVSRLCLTVLQQRRTRGEVPFGADAPPPAAEERDPEQEAILAESVGVALLVVLDRLTPAERVAFVLHDMFGIAFSEIAAIVGRSEAAARQLASRARRRVRVLEHTPTSRPNSSRHDDLVRRFLAAARDGDLALLVELLDPDVVLCGDQTAVVLGAAAETRGAPAVAQRLVGWARGMTAAGVDGAAGAAWRPGGQLRVVFAFDTDGTRITLIDLVANPARLSELTLEFAAD